MTKQLVSSKRLCLCNSSILQWSFYWSTSSFWTSLSLDWFLSWTEITRTSLATGTLSLEKHSVLPSWWISSLHISPSLQSLCSDCSQDGKIEVSLLNGRSNQVTMEPSITSRQRRLLKVNWTTSTQAIRFLAIMCMLRTLLTCSVWWCTRLVCQSCIHLHASSILCSTGSTSSSWSNTTRQPPPSTRCYHSTPSSGSRQHTLFI